MMKNANDMKDNKNKFNGDKKDNKTTDKNDKVMEKNDKVDRPIKGGKNKHSFVVAGKEK